MLDNHFYQWQEWNKQGLIPGLKESKIDFENRVNFCLNLENYLKEKSSIEIPFHFESEGKKLLEEVAPITESLYGIAPLWTPIFFSNYQLKPWHGGCAWIFKLNEETPTTAFLQLRAQFRHFSTYLGIYQKKELMAHEIAHIGRMSYDEPLFEEILAYQSSHTKWRQWLGSLIQSSVESLIFILSLFLVIFSDLATLIFPYFFNTSFLLIIKIIPIGLLFFALIRLSYRQYLFKRCQENLKKIYSDKQTSHLLYRLSDAEIKHFAQSSSFEIKDFIIDSSNESFRWHFLHTLYPIN